MVLVAIVGYIGYWEGSLQWQGLCPKASTEILSHYCQRF